MEGGFSLIVCSMPVRSMALVFIHRRRCGHAADRDNAAVPSRLSGDAVDSDGHSGVSGYDDHDADSHFDDHRGVVELLPAPSRCSPKRKWRLDVHGPSLKVAFVDDETANCRLGLRMLARLGVDTVHNVTVIADGEVAFLPRRVFPFVCRSCE